MQVQGAFCYLYLYLSPLVRKAQHSTIRRQQQIEDKPEKAYNIQD